MSDMKTELKYIEEDEDFIDIIENADISVENKMELINKAIYHHSHFYGLYLDWAGVGVILELAFCDLNIFVLLIPNISMFDYLMGVFFFAVFAISFYIESKNVVKILAHDMFVREVPVMSE